MDSVDEGGGDSTLLPTPNSDLKLAPVGDFFLSYEAEVMQISRSRDYTPFSSLAIIPKLSFESPQNPREPYSSPEEERPSRERKI